MVYSYFLYLYSGNTSKSNVARIEGILLIVYQSGIVISFDNHMTSQRGGHSKIREF